MVLKKIRFEFTFPSQGSACFPSILNVMYAAELKTSGEGCPLIRNDVRNVGLTAYEEKVRWEFDRAEERTTAAIPNSDSLLSLTWAREVSWRTSCRRL